MNAIQKSISMYDFSVIVAFDGTGKLEQTLDSICSQEEVSVQIIIVTNDLSSNLFTIQKCNNLIVVQERSPGVYGALNTGLEHVRGALVTFISSGAQYTSNNIFAKYRECFLQHNNLFITTGWIQKIDSDRSDTFKLSSFNSIKHFWSRQQLNIESMAVRASVFDEINFDEKFQISADFKFIRDLIRKSDPFPLQICSVVLPPAGISHKFSDTGEKEIFEIRNIYLSNYFFSQAPSIQRFVLKLLKFPAVIKTKFAILRGNFHE